MATGCSESMGPFNRHLSNISTALSEPHLLSGDIVDLKPFFFLVDKKGLTPLYELSVSRISFECLR